MTEAKQHRLAQGDERVGGTSDESQCQGPSTQRSTGRRKRLRTGLTFVRRLIPVR